MIEDPDPVWVTASGAHQRISEMEPHHLARTILHLERDARNRARLFGGTWEEHLDPRYEAMVERAKGMGVDL